MKRNRKEYAHKYYLEHRQRMSERSKLNYIANNNRRKQRNEARRITVLSHYSQGKLVCVHCGYSDIRALTIDHIKGGGGKHRKELNRSGSGFFFWLIQQAFPEGYQTLCWNCQAIKKLKEHEYRWKTDANIL